MSKWVSVEEAIQMVSNKSSIAFAGFASIGIADDFFKELERSFLEKGTPNQLTVVHAACPSEGTMGLSRLAHKGLVSKVIGSHWGVAPKIGQMIADGDIEAQCVSQGQLVLLYRDIARKGPGLISKVGLETFLDPAYEGGKMNKTSQESESLIDRIEINNERYLHYKPFPIHFALLRGTTADEKGNISVEDEGLLFENLSLAQAVKRWGGTVMFQVKHKVKNGTLSAKSVQVPAHFVDYIVQTKEAKENHRISKSYFEDESISGQKKRSVETSSALPLTIRKVIGRRAVCELKNEKTINAGVGIPGDTIVKLLHEEKMADDILSTIESGVYGGVAQGGPDFGLSQNAEAIIDHASQFDFYNGAGVDTTFMGVAEIDAGGNVNVSKMKNRVVGCGGFIDITQNSKKVIFCTTFTAGGLEAEINENGLSIMKEGKVKKFVEETAQITFNGRYSSDRGIPVIYITERAVFELNKDRLILTEIAPGINLQKDILDQMEFKPEISKQLKTMDIRLFQEAPMGIKEKPYHPETASAELNV